jgi:1-acyl-sn-glycerol-3-phosphate acyltransferase
VGLLALVRDWAFTVPFLLAFGLVLLVFDGLQRVARAFGRRPHELVVGALQVSLVQALRIAGATFEVERSPKLVPGAAYLFVSNHQSMFDIPLIGTLLFRHFPKYISKRELARRWIPSISYNLRRGGNALIDRSNRASAVEEIRRLGESEVRGRGVSAVIFPEGTRARTGELGPFKAQGLAALMAAAPEAPVVPIAIDGSWRIVSRGLAPVPFGTRVRVHIGDPVPRRPDEDPYRMAESARAEITAVLEAWRGDVPPG